MDPNNVKVVNDLGERSDPAERVESSAEANESFASIADGLASDAPAPNPAAIAAHDEREREQRAAYADLRDADGNPFDPAAHVTDIDGAPKLTARGKLRKRPGRKAGVSGGTSRLGGLDTATEGQGSSAADRAQARAAGMGAANALIALGVTFGGDEWKPVKSEQIDERDNLEQSFGAYFEAKGLRDIPPGVALSIAVLGYVAPRLTQPQTQSRLSRLRANVTAWIAKRRAKNVPRPDTRTNGKRKNDAGERTVQPESTEADST